MHEHRNCHRSNTTRNRCNIRSDLLCLFETDIPAQLIFFISVNSDIDDNRSFFDIIGTDITWFSNSHNQNIRLFADFFEIFGP